MIVATKNPTLFAEIGYTPDIEGGAGPVKIGEPVRFLEGSATWYVIHHDPFTEVDYDWLSAWTQGDNPPIVLFETIPATWTQPAIA